MWAILGPWREGSFTKALVVCARAFRTPGNTPTTSPFDARPASRPEVVGFACIQNRDCGSQAHPGPRLWVSAEPGVGKRAGTFSTWDGGRAGRRGEWNAMSKRCPPSSRHPQTVATCPPRRSDEPGSRGGEAEQKLFRSLKKISRPLTPAGSAGSHPCTLSQRLRRRYSFVAFPRTGAATWGRIAREGAGGYPRGVGAAVGVTYRQGSPSSLMGELSLAPTSVCFSSK